VNVSALPKVRVNVGGFLAWSERLPGDADTRFMDDLPVAGIPGCFIGFAAGAIVHRRATGKTESPGGHNGKTPLDAPGISDSVAASLGS
jgi:hypothetical protein